MNWQPCCVVVEIAQHRSVCQASLEIFSGAVGCKKSERGIMLYQSLGLLTLIIGNEIGNAKNVLFLGPNHLLTTGTDDPTLQLSPEHQQE